MCSDLEVQDCCHAVALPSWSSSFPGLRKRRRKRGCSWVKMWRGGKKKGVESSLKLTTGRAVLCAEMTASTAAES